MKTPLKPAKSIFKMLVSERVGVWLCDWGVGVLSPRALECVCVLPRASYEHLIRVNKAARRRAESKLIGGGSLGRSFARGCAPRLPPPPPPPLTIAAAVASAPNDPAAEDKDTRRASLRVSHPSA